MPDNVVLIIRFHPVGGADVSVVSEDFGGEREALEAIAQALDKRRSLVLTHARYNREADQNGVIINLAGFFWLTQRAIAEMVSRYGGHVVNVSATIAEVTNSGTPAVVAALTKGERARSRSRGQQQSAVTRPGPPRLS